MNTSDVGFQCPFPFSQYPIITMAHGAGGRLTQQLLEGIFRPAFNNPILQQQHDGAMLKLPSERIAVSTDSYVVDPLFFPGGNIGKLAVIGTLNDLAMCGAKPLYITCGFILTEGLSSEVLVKVVAHMRQAAIENNIAIVSGDIKVVERTASAGLYINTTGIGALPPEYVIAPDKIQSGDAIIISGDIGRHGLAVLSQRNNYQFEPPIESDCAPLWGQVSQLFNEQLTPHCLRDLTRGGLAGALIELADSARLTFEIQEDKIPISQAVHAGCEILGIDPLYVANEGRMIVFCPADVASQTIACLRKFSDGAMAECIGHVLPKVNHSPGKVVLKTSFKTSRTLTLFSGEQLPRIC
ncbi:MAG: hydrogenase expression/formation protein HypE [Proteobacteria bacterium]|nr:hydrogenase expression/formation protein HypE [Pseudomonadota bacterium]